MTVTTAPCPVCGGNRAEPFLAAKHPGLVRCACGLVGWAELPDASELDRLYNEQVYSGVPYYERAYHADVRTFRRVFPEIEARVAPGRALDLGCAAGAFLVVAGERGWRAEGIDLNRAAVETCLRRGLAASPGVLTPGRYPPGSFRLVHMGDVIEHVPDPAAVLRETHSVLEPGGVVAISTPNIASWAAKEFQIKPGEHLWYFDSATLARALSDAGFRDVTVRLHDRDRSLAGLADSPTFARRPLARAALRAVGWVIPDSFSFRIPFGENLLAFGRR